MTRHETASKVRSIEWPKARSTQWRWQKIARRIRVPLGFLTAALYLFEAVRHPAHPEAIRWSFALVLPGLALRAAASGTVKKNRELTVSGPYAYTRNPLYLGSIFIAAGFAVALLSWLVTVVLATVFAVIYIPVIAAEEQFLRATFPGFDDYCRRVPRLLPRIIPQRGTARFQSGQTVQFASSQAAQSRFSPALYLKHREYNAVLGASLLYLSLLYLRPALDRLLHLPR